MNDLTKPDEIERPATVANPVDVFVRLVIDPKTIKPKVRGKADFYSWQLYRWAKKYPGRLQIFKGTWNSSTGLNGGNPTLYIGLMDEDGSGWFHGAQLRHICCVGRKIESWAYGPNFDTANWEDATEWFWDEYMRIGVCAIHGDLWHDWSICCDTRTCTRCGATEHKQVVEFTRDVWIAA